MSANPILDISSRIRGCVGWTEDAEVREWIGPRLHQIEEASFVMIRQRDELVAALQGILEVHGLIEGEPFEGAFNFDEYERNALDVALRAYRAAKGV